MVRSYEVRNSSINGKGVFALRTFQPNEMVMIGVFDQRSTRNQPRASQVSENGYAILAGVIQLVNHSCEPNCGISLNSSGAHDFVAMRTILPGEELTFDYAMRNYRLEHFEGLCTCGSDRCRGEISGWADLPDELKLEYQGFVAPYLLELDQRGELQSRAPEPAATAA